MPRTVVPTRVPPATDRRDRAPAAAVPGDSLPEALVKYVPAEFLAAYIPLVAAATSERQNLVLAAFVIGLIGLPLYLYALAPKDAQSPHWWTYLLAMAAFAGWAIGTTTATAKLFGLDSVAGAFILAGVVFIVPLLDKVLDKRWPSRQN